MCTAATYKTKDFYFGRTLDYEFSYGDEVAITPRNYRFHFRELGDIAAHYAIIGMAHIVDDYPLYYDAVNEKGLAAAGLNFVGSAVYHPHIDGKDNVAQFELIPWILSRCATVADVRLLIERMNILDISYSDSLPVAQLHWIIADRNEAITLECVADGMKVYDNPVGVLTNNPPFDKQLFALNNYAHLSPRSVECTFAPENTAAYCQNWQYSRGMGAIGLPGDLSSQSRFVRAAFVKLNSRSGDSEMESVSQFFHILNSVDQQRGCCELASGECEITIYTSCCNTDKGIYYYTTYNNHQISAVDMHRENLDGSVLIHYTPITDEQINFQN